MDEVIAISGAPIVTYKDTQMRLVDFVRRAAGVDGKECPKRRRAGSGHDHDDDDEDAGGARSTFQILVTSFLGIFGADVCFGASTHRLLCVSFRFRCFCRC